MLQASRIKPQTIKERKKKKKRNLPAWPSCFAKAMLNKFVINSIISHLGQPRCLAHLPAWRMRLFMFCKAWVGLFANGLPGLECGSQPIESFHSKWERVRNGFGGREDIMRILQTMKTLYESDDTFTELWGDAARLNLHTPVEANPDLLSGDVLRRANLSPAVDYHVSQVVNHVVLETATYFVVAVQNTHTQDELPAEVPVSAALARLGADAIHSSDRDLRRLLFEAEVFFLTSTGRVAISVSRFRNIFEDIAFVILKPLPASWQSLDKPVCTCHMYGVQQQCQHTLFVEGLPLPGIAHPRNFEEAVLHRNRGRPKGAAKPAPKRRHGE
jgi:hypothetical protein